MINDNSISKFIKLNFLAVSVYFLGFDVHQIIFLTPTRHGAHPLLLTTPEYSLFLRP